MVKIVSTRDVAPERRVFSVEQDGAPASRELLTRIVLVASRLLAENELPGAFRLDEETGGISLETPSSDRSYFHDGILFAALDVFNDPTKNPTLFRFSLEAQNESGAGGSSS
jgi:hypothetical protein